MSVSGCEFVHMDAVPVQARRGPCGWSYRLFWEIWSWCWEVTLGPLWEQQVPLTPEPLLQPLQKVWNQRQLFILLMKAKSDSGRCWLRRPAWICEGTSENCRLNGGLRQTSPTCFSLLTKNFPDPVCWWRRTMECGSGYCLGSAGTTLSADWFPQGYGGLWTTFNSFLRVKPQTAGSTGARVEPLVAGPWSPI